MKIIQFINALGGGGAEVFVTQLSVALSKNESNEVYLITYAGIIDKKGIDLKKKIDNSSVKYLNIGEGSGIKKHANIIIALNNLVKRFNPDVLHAHLQPADIFLSIVKQLKPGLKIVRTLHNARHTKFIPHALEPFFFKKFNANISCSDYVKENFVASHLRPSIKSIPNGIDIEILKSYSKKQTKEEYRKLLGIPSASNVFINIGSMYLTNGLFSKKNQQLLVDAIGLLKNNAEVFMIFLGDGPLRSALQDRANELGVSSNILFAGLVNSPYEYILSADFCAMPSSDEGLPISLIESVCSGLPSILSSIDAFKPFECSSTIFLSSFAKEELAEKMQFIIDNKALYSAEGKLNIEQFKSKFDIDKVATRHMDLYRSIQ